MNTRSGFASLVAGFLISATAFAEEVKTVPNVDLNKYLGKWYEVASIPQVFQKQCVGNTTAEYSFAEKELIKVLNSCDTKSGKRSVAEGRAKVVDSETQSKLKVTFVKLFDWTFTFGGNYWILELGPNYSYSVVGDPSREYAWILSRTPSLDLATLAGIEARLKAQGYDTSKILTSLQKGGFETRQPLNEVVAGAKDIVDIAVEAGQFQTLVSAVQLAGLEETLRSPGPLTVFAPTDAAFAKLGEATLNAVIADPQLLQAVLTYHVVPGLKNSDTIARDVSLTTVLGKNLTFSLRDGRAFINDSEITVANIPAKNGLIHVIDTVMVP